MTDSQRGPWTIADEPRNCASAEPAMSPAAGSAMTRMRAACSDAVCGQDED